MAGNHSAGPADVSLPALDSRCYMLLMLLLINIHPPMNVVEHMLDKNNHALPPNVEI